MLVTQTQSVTSCLNTCHANVLEFGHELAVEAAHGVPGEEPGPLRSQQVIHPARGRTVIECMIFDTSQQVIHPAGQNSH